MGACLGTGPRPDESLDLVPVLAVELETLYELLVLVVGPFALVVSI